MAQLKLKAEEIIEQFHTYVDDDTELSTTEEYLLLNKKYAELQNERAWEWCKKTLSQAVTFNSTLYIDLPENFRGFVEDEEYGFGAYFVIMVGSTQHKYPIYPHAKRHQYKDYAYFDPTTGANGTGRLYLPKSFVSGSLQLDYVAQLDSLEEGDYPAFRGGFHPILSHMMALDFSILERSEKARNYDGENRAAVANYIEDMALEDANLKDWNNEY